MKPSILFVLHSAWNDTLASLNRLRYLALVVFLICFAEQLAGAFVLPEWGKTVVAFDSLRQCYRTGQRGVGELARCHRLAEQEALSNFEAQLFRGDEVGAALDAFGDRPNTTFVREIDDTAADGLLQAVIAKAGDELAVHLELDERNGRKGG
jgi:hypothetical protein